MSMFRPVVLVSVLIEGQEDAYEAAHQRIPVDLHASLTGAGVRDWAIWRDGRTLLHLVDVDDFAAVERKLAGDPVNDRWQAEMAVFVERFEQVTAIPRPVRTDTGLVNAAAGCQRHQARCIEMIDDARVVDIPVMHEAAVGPVRGGFGHPVVPGIGHD